MSNAARVLALDEPEFGAALNQVLSPANAIQSPEFLRGRSKQLEEIRQALYSPGRQVFIYGFKGVGKTSLAQTAAYQHQSTESFPIAVGCAQQTSCFSVVRDIAREAFPADPRTHKTTSQKSFSFSFKGVANSEKKRTVENERFPAPDSINDAVRLLSYVAENHSKSPVVIIDEFDQIKDRVEQNLFANLIKQLADKKVGIKIIFCGVGESIDQLIDAHLSAPRYLHPVNLGRLPYEAREEIIVGAADYLGISIDDTTKYRIEMISDGFPHYVHLICEKLFWRVYNAKNRGFVNGDLFETALSDAAAALEPELKKPYERATKKYRDVREPILWAVADGDELHRPSRDIWQSYLRIVEELKTCGKLKEAPLDRTKFNSAMASLKSDASGCILKGTRAGWYEFSERVVRGYARLRAMQRGIVLEREHPLQSRRYV